MKAALREARVDPADIDYINAHGTSTRLNDLMETVAVKRVFGHRAGVDPDELAEVDGRPPDRRLGGARGRRDRDVARARASIPPTINQATPDPDCDLDYVPNTAREMPLRTAISNSFGFGGQNASLVMTPMSERPAPRSADGRSRADVAGPDSARRSRPTRIGSAASSASLDAFEPRMDAGSRMRRPRAMDRLVCSLVVAPGRASAAPGPGAGSAAPAAAERLPIPAGLAALRDRRAARPGAQAGHGARAGPVHEPDVGSAVDRAGLPRLSALPGAGRRTGRSCSRRWRSSGSAPRRRWTPRGGG